MDFYYVDADYINYLKEYEKKRRGYTRVPNIIYQERNKFIFGAVMKINGINYYVALSSQKKKNESTIIIRVDKDKDRIKGSLRFNYMIPVPDSCIKRLEINEIENRSYRRLVYKEWEFCKKKEIQISIKARKVYDKVISCEDETLADNSCNFKLLEEAYNKYIIENNK